jgi:hypothetical protein
MQNNNNNYKILLVYHDHTFISGSNRITTCTMITLI